MHLKTERFKKSSKGMFKKDLLLKVLKNVFIRNESKAWRQEE